jgi:hypothetical protein
VCHLILFLFSLLDALPILLLSIFRIRIHIFQALFQLLLIVVRSILLLLFYSCLSFFHLIGYLNYQVLGTGEPHGTIQFRGAFDTVSQERGAFDTVSQENRLFFLVFILLLTTVLFPRVKRIWHKLCELRLFKHKVNNRWIVPICKHQPSSRSWPDLTD